VVSEFIATTSLGWPPTSRPMGFAHFLVVWQPRMLRRDVTFDSQRRPIVQFLLNRPARGLRLQPE